MYTVISVIASLPVLPLDRHIPPRSFDDTSPSAPLLMTGPAANFLQFSPKAPPRETTVQTVQKKCRSRTGGRGVIPLPPRLFFSKRGSPPPPMCRARWGYPPPPPAPGHANRHIPGKCRKTRFPAGDSTRNDGLGRAEKVPFADLGGRGVIPLPPHLFFSKRGSPPPPMCRARRGVSPTVLKKRAGSRDGNFLKDRHRPATD